MCTTIVFIPFANKETSMEEILSFPEKKEKNYKTSKQPHKDKQNKKTKQMTVLERKKLFITLNKAFLILVPEFLNDF